MEELIIKLFFFLKIDLISNKLERIIKKVRIMRLSRNTHQQFKYVNQGWHTPILTNNGGRGTFLMGKGSHLKSDSYIEYMGNVMGDLTSRRGRPLGQESRGNALKIDAMVPLSEMFGYATSLRSNSQGRGNFTMTMDHYEEVPKNIADEIIKKNGREQN